MTPPTTPRIEQFTFADREALTTALADTVAGALRAGIAERGRARLAVSGGRTPEPLFRRLAAMPLDWSAVDVTLADERWVAPDHPDSNEALVRRSLLTGPAAAARFTGLYTGAATPEDGAAAAAARLARFDGPFDLVLLGMGDDGHTASLFPDADGLAAALDPGGPEPVRAIRAPGIAQPRLTLTLPRLLDARAIILLLTGEAKLPVLDRALADGPAEEMPVRAVLRQDRVPVALYWAP